MGDIKDDDLDSEEVNSDYSSMESEYNSVYECSDIISALEEAIKDLYSNYEKWLQRRLKSIEEIRGLADELHGHQKNVNIARVTGTTVGAAATVAGVVFTGLALAPFTAGTSMFIGLGIGAGVVGGAGAGTSLGALLTKRSLEKKRWEVLKEIVEADSEITDSLRSDIKKYDETLASLMQMTQKQDSIALPRTVLAALTGAHSVAEKITLTVLRDVIRTAAGVTTEAVEGGAKIALMTSRVMGGIGVALSGISLIFDVIQLVEVSKNISHGSKCEVANRLEEIADIMEKEMQEILDYMEAILREDSSAASEEEEKLRNVLDDQDFNVLFNSSVPAIVQNALDKNATSGNESDNQANLQTGPNKSYYMLTAPSIEDDYDFLDTSNVNNKST